eukprot:g4379.t1
MRGLYTRAEERLLRRLSESMLPLHAASQDDDQLTPLLRLPESLLVLACTFLGFCELGRLECSCGCFQRPSSGLALKTPCGGDAPRLLLSVCEAAARARCLNGAARDAPGSGGGWKRQLRWAEESDTWIDRDLETSHMLLRPCHMVDGVAFAVAAADAWEPGRRYGAPPGWRVATTAEGQRLFDGSGIGPFVHSGQAGWLQCRWRGLLKHHFRFQDSHHTGAYKHAGSRELDTVRVDNFDVEYFAGMVLVHEDMVVADPAAGPAGDAHGTTVEGRAPEVEAWAAGTPGLADALFGAALHDMSAEDLAAVVDAMADD